MKTSKSFNLDLIPKQGRLWLAIKNLYQKEFLEESGLSFFNEKWLFEDLKRYDGNFSFTIQNYSGKVLGFGGRSLDQKTSKYLNSPENPYAAHKKQEYLCGLYFSKSEIGEKIIVL